VPSSINGRGYKRSKSIWKQRLTIDWQSKSLEGVNTGGVPFVPRPPIGTKGVDVGEEAEDVVLADEDGVGVDCAKTSLARAEEANISAKTNMMLGETLAKVVYIRAIDDDLVTSITLVLDIDSTVWTLAHLDITSSATR
jgi:hypothetical protein